MAYVRKAIGDVDGYVMDNRNNYFYRMLFFMIDDREYFKNDYIVD